MVARILSSNLVDFKTARILSTPGRWITIVLLLCIGLFASGCADPRPGATLYVIAPVGTTETDALDDMRSKAETIAISLGFEPAPNAINFVLFESYPDGRTMLVLAVYQLREDQEVHLGLLNENISLVGNTLAFYLSDHGVVSRFGFRDHSIAKKKLSELYERLRDEFGADRIYLTDWAQEQLQQ